MWLLATAVVIERGVVEPDPREQLAPLGAVHAAVEDRHLDRLARAVVGDRDALGHEARHFTIYSGELSCLRLAEGLALGGEQVEGGGHLAAGVGRIDDRVDEAPSAATYGLRKRSS